MRLFFALLLLALAAMPAAAECPSCRRTPVRARSDGGAVGLHPVRFWSQQWEKLERRSAQNPQAASLAAGALAFGLVVAGVKTWRTVRSVLRPSCGEQPAEQETRLPPP